jgi:hypothetical protein
MGKAEAGQDRIKSIFAVTGKRIRTLPIDTKPLRISDASLRMPTEGLTRRNSICETRPAL